MTLASAIAEARAIVLAQEQPLLRMLTRERASRAALQAAVAAFRRAANLLEECLR